MNSEINDFFESKLFQSFGVGRFLCLALLILCLVGGASAFAGGSGTSNDPYQIETCQQLQDMSNDRYESYELISNVNCSDTDNWNNGKGFNPIGDGYNNEFHGVLDGNGYIITDLYVNRTLKNGGLIDRAGPGATIKNVGLTDVEIYSTQAFAGGIVGLNFGGVVENSFSSGYIEARGGTSVGGIVGANDEGGEVRDSFSVADVQGGSNNGYFVGGLVGDNAGASIISSYAAGQVSTEGSAAGGLSGEGGSATDSYWDVDASGMSSSSTGTGFSTSEMTYPNAESNLNFDFSNIWETCNGGNQGYPFQQVFKGKAFTCNSLPQFKSSSVNPDPPLIGENVSYEVDSSDGDGTIEEVSLELYDDGSQVFSDTDTSVSSSSVSKSFSDVYEATQGGLDAKFTVTDDAGAQTVEWLNRTLTNTAPTVSIVSPSNSTFWSYSRPFEVEVNANTDSVPNESFTCQEIIDGSNVGSSSGTGSETFTGSYSVDLGSHSLKWECSDSDGNTASDSVNFTVKAFEEESVFGSSPVFETENSSFQTDLKTGSMVNSVDFSLNYSGSVVDTESLPSSGVGTLGSSLYHEAPLVSSNQSLKNWSVSYDVNITDLGSSNSYSVLSGETATNSQEVLKAFYLDSQSLDKNQYVAGDDITYTGTIVNKTGKASVSGNVENSQKNISVDLTQSRINDSKSSFTGVTSTDSISQSSLNVDVVPDYTVSFNGQSRSLEASTLSTSLEQLEFGLCSNVNGETALEFTTYDEKNRTETVDSELNFAAEYWNPDTPSQKKVANFSNSGVSSHELCVSPGYAEAQVDSTDKLIQYSDPGNDYVLRSYFLINETVDNTTTNIPLYMLKKSEAERVRFEVQDENRNPLSNVVIRVQRYFPSVDKQLTTAMVKTGAEGQTETFLEVNEIYYAFNLYQDGQLQKEVGQQVIPSDLSLVFTLGGDNPPNWYDYEDTVSHDCRYNATQVTCDYESTTESLENVSLTVSKEGVVSPVQVGESFGTTASGSITVQGFNASKNRLTYRLEANFQDDVRNLLEVQSLGNNTSVIGDTGLMISLFMFLTMSFAGLWKPSASVVLGVFALIVSSFLPFLAVSQTALTALIALAAVLVWRMS